MLFLLMFGHQFTAVSRIVVLVCLRMSHASYAFQFFLRTESLQWQFCQEYRLPGYVTRCQLSTSKYFDGDWFHGSQFFQSSHFPVEEHALFFGPWKHPTLSAFNLILTPSFQSCLVKSKNNHQPTSATQSPTHPSTCKLSTLQKHRPFGKVLSTHHHTPPHTSKHHYIPLHTTTHHYTPLHTSKHHYILLHTTTHHYTPLHTTTHHYSPLHTTTHHHTPLHTTTHYYTPLHITKSH